MNGADLLGALGIQQEPAPSPSDARFPDGAHFRIEIPSVEGPQVLRAALETAAELGVTINRVSQGSGAMLLSGKELKEMARMGADAGLEVSLFVGPREEWGLGSHARAADGPALAGKLRGVRQLRYAIDDVLRAIENGIRGFLVADSGLLEVLTGLQAARKMPANVVWKVSVMLAPTNPVTLRQLERLGAATVNLPSDMTLADLAAMRAASAIPLDLYVEAPDGIGGVVRGNESADLIAVAAPLYVKLGLRNAPNLYPGGLHLAGQACDIAREKVHRAAIALEWIARSGQEFVQSKPGAKSLGIPEP